MRADGRADVAFLFLGEMLLVPHLWPIADALARLRPDLRIDLWVSTSVHAELIGSWLTTAHGNVRLRQAPGFLALQGFERGQNPPLPHKIPMLLRIARHLWGVRVVVCAEQTSLWLPRILTGLSRFIFTAHGAGAPNYNRDGRLKCAYRLFFPTKLHLTKHLAHGIDPGRIISTGYVKASFQPSLVRSDLFSNDRPIVLYAPHWQRYRSSWWDWGREIVAMLAAQDRYNVILAPHQRLFERDPEAAAMLQQFSALDHVHVDLGSFAMVDGSYTRMANLYLGDSSSQIVEFVSDPRPALLLDTPGMAWLPPEECGYWGCGDTITDIADLRGAIDAAFVHHERYLQAQKMLVEQELGDTTGQAAVCAAEGVISALR